MGFITMTGVYILVFSCLLSLLVIWILIQFSVNLGVRNSISHKKNDIRWQKKKPSIGGLAFVFVFLIVNSILTIIYYDFNDILKNKCFEVGLLISLFSGFLIGLVDDAKNTNPILKLIGQIACGLILVYFKIIINISPNIFWNSLLTVIWVVVLMNSINMLDNMDGLTSLISILILMSMIAFRSMPVDYISAIMFILIGILIGFLYFNWFPSKIYMGDSGSQFLGIALAALSILSIFNERELYSGYFQLKQFFLPLMIFTLPLFDTTTVIIHRLLKRNSPFVGGKDHLSHHLVYLGFRDNTSVLILASIELFFSCLGIYVFVHFGSNYTMLLYGISLWIIAFLILQAIYIKGAKAQSIHSKRAS